MQTLLLVGANGQLGREVAALLEAGKGGPWTVPPRFAETRVVGVDIDTLDITDAGAVDRTLREIQPNAVINCAAMTAVDACEAQREAAFRANALGPLHLARACTETGAALLHVSTDYVFSGDAKIPYAEWDATGPRTVYGQSKLLGEGYVRAHCPRSFVVRSAWLYGRYGANFVQTIIKAARERGELAVVDDQRGNPTNVLDLAYHLLKILDGGTYGLYHVTGGGECSWYEFAREILRLTGIPCALRPCTTAEYPRPAARPAYSSLDHLALRCTVGDEMRDWREALSTHLQSLAVEDL